MEIEIKNKFNGKVIICEKYESIKDCLENNKNKLRGAYLRGAYLRDADLQGAYLRGAKYKEPLFLSDLYSLKLLPKDTILTFWKYLSNGFSPYQNFKYEIDKEYRFKDFNKDENIQCGEDRKGAIKLLKDLMKNK